MKEIRAFGETYVRLESDEDRFEIIDISPSLGDFEDTEDKAFNDPEVNLNKGQLRYYLSFCSFESGMLVYFDLIREGFGDIKSYNLWEDKRYQILRKLITSQDFRHPVYPIFTISILVNHKDIQKFKTFLKSLDIKFSMKIRWERSLRYKDPDIIYGY